MFDIYGHRRKLIVFTEHRDTLTYLCERISAMLGMQAVVAIHGAIARDERKRVQELFAQDRTVLVLVATDAAGEGVNLQRAHLMVNYDLPWNPNRIEQRFGRIHRIGQTEVAISGILSRMKRERARSTPHCFGNWSERVRRSKAEFSMCSVKLSTGLSFAD